MEFKTENREPEFQQVRSFIYISSGGSQTHTHTHTCSEQSLRILMWNAPYVQKQSSYTWQEWVGEKTREGIEKSPAETVHLMK